MSGNKTPIIRVAKPGDKKAVLEFTKNTWDWGDYIADVWDRWVIDKNGELLVAELDDEPVGILHIQFLPDQSAWLEGLRVNPAFRRRGIALSLNKEALLRVKERGISVVRLVIAEWNKPSINLAVKLGFKAISDWISVEISRDNLKSYMGGCERLSDFDDLWECVGGSLFYKLSKGCSLNSNYRNIYILFTTIIFVIRYEAL